MNNDSGPVATFSLLDSIRIAPEAAAHFRAQLAKSGHCGVRISLKESGCSGYMYAVEEVDAGQADDLEMTLEDGLILYFDPADALALRGTEIVYTRQGLNRHLKFRNPNATNACGCGESFTIDLKEPDLEGDGNS